MFNAFLILWSVLQVGPPNLTLEQTIYENSVIPYQQAMIIVAIESTFDVKAESPVGAKGLMQVRPVALEEVQATAVRLGLRGDKITEGEATFIHECLKTVTYKYEDILDPAVNVTVGTCYFSLLLLKYEGDTYTALAFYNGGGKAVRALQRYKAWPDTKDYLGKYDLYSYYINYKEK